MTTSGETSPRETGRPLPVRREQEPPVWEAGELRVRRYRPADHATVLRLHREGLAQVGLRPGDGVYYDHDFFRMEEIYLSNDGEFLVGEAGGAIVAMGGLRRADLVPGGHARAFGAAVLGPAEAAAAGLAVAGGVPGATGLDAVEMVRLRVRPDRQGRGHGTALVRILEDRAAELGYRVLRADTTSQQTTALALYRRFGWRETRRERIGGLVNVYLEKQLR
ncbi:GNAT family N-acetyltransferase [Actinomadura atramentaria]|uniref:GNAT family N-acetyltransferase n=1 Tax=Actinomadura atramentaria TaxID=1990 RepID=UPI00035D1F73|nr:GNAT family N-acetyltransferase [Actinomadura atramentaria]